MCTIGALSTTAVDTLSMHLSIIGCVVEVVCSRDGVQQKWCEQKLCCDIVLLELVVMCRCDGVGREMYCPGNTLTVTTDGTTDSFDNDVGEG